MTDWRDRALCRETDPDAFFPAPRTSPAAAKAICAACEVREQCLEYALDTNQGYGVWGGTTETERRRIRRARSARSQRSRDAHARKKTLALDLYARTGSLTLAAQEARVTERTILRWAKGAS